MDNNTRKALEGTLSRFHSESLSSGERLLSALTLFQALSRRYQDLLERSKKQEKEVSALSESIRYSGIQSSSSRYGTGWNSGTYVQEQSLRCCFHTSIPSDAAERLKALQTEGESIRSDADLLQQYLKAWEDVLSAAYSLPVRNTAERDAQNMLLATEARGHWKRRKEEYNPVDGVSGHALRLSESLQQKSAYKRLKSSLQQREGSGLKGRRSISAGEEHLSERVYSSAAQEVSVFSAALGKYASEFQSFRHCSAERRAEAGFQAFCYTQKGSLFYLADVLNSEGVRSTYREQEGERTSEQWLSSHSPESLLKVCFLLRKGCFFKYIKKPSFFYASDAAASRVKAARRLSEMLSPCRSGVSGIPFAMLSAEEHRELSIPASVEFKIGEEQEVSFPVFAWKVYCSGSRYGSDVSEQIEFALGKSEHPEADALLPFVDTFHQDAESLFSASAEQKQKAAERLKGIFLGRLSTAIDERRRAAERAASEAERLKRLRAEKAQWLRRLRRLEEVSLEDSYSSGNCRIGTASFCSQLKVSAESISGSGLAQAWKKAQYPWNRLFFKVIEEAEKKKSLSAEQPEAVAQA